MYEFDVFVSYRRSRFNQRWIRSEFIREFEERLEVEIGRTPAIFWDETSVADGDVAIEVILHALRHSRCLLSILSAPYFSSAWCSAEWETFKQRAVIAKLGAGKTLTIPLQWQDGENYMPLLRGEGPRPRDFTNFRLEGPAWRDSPVHVDYQRELNSLAEHVARLVDRVPNFDPQWPVIDPRQPPPEAVPAPRPTAWPYKLGGDPAGAS